mgnify:CR=1 FL=1
MSYRILDEDDVRALRELRARVLGTRGPGVTNAPDGITIARPAVPRRGLSVSGPVVQMFRVQSVDEDHLVCRTWDGTTVGADDVKIAKPPELRRTGIHGQTLVEANGTFSYSYTSNIARTKTDTSDSSTENQVITPPYETVYPLCLIFAIKGIAGGTDAEDGAAATDDLEPIVWQDMNFAGRAWAKVTA